MDSEEVIFVQEKRKYRRKKGCSVMPLPKKAKKPSPKMEAAAKTTRKYTKKALILKKAIKISRSTLRNLNLFNISGGERRGETTLEEGERFGAAASSELPQGGRSHSHPGRSVHLRGRGASTHFSTPCQGAAGLQPLLRPPADDTPPSPPPPTATTVQLLPSSLHISIVRR